MFKISKAISFSILFFLLFSACQKSTSLKPEMWIVDDSHVMFDGKEIEILDIANTIRDYRSKIDPAYQDSVQVRFVLEQGIDMVVLEQVKTELQNGGITDLKFVAPWE